jgi:FdhD protein
MDTHSNQEQTLVLKKHQVDRWRNSVKIATEDFLAVEIPVAIEYNGISHAVMLASPADLEDFALGFSLTEGIIEKKSEMFDCEVEIMPEGIIVKTEIATRQFELLKNRRRNLTGRTGCGLCGVETIEQAVRHPALITHHHEIQDTLILKGMKLMQELQLMHQSCGATHAAAWLNFSGEIICVREDVGRHNALDKLIGSLAKADIEFAAGVALITSRASYEMVQKCASVGIGILAAVSAPTSLATQLADNSGLTLIGYMREQSYVIYAHPQRINQV